MRRLLLLAGTLAALALTLVLLGFHALKSEAGKERIAGALSDALGQPVAIGDMSVSLLPTPALEMRQIQIGSADRGAAPGITLAGLRIVPEVLSVLPGRTPSVSHMDLVGLVVSVRRDASGRWLLPASLAAGPAHPRTKSATAVELDQLRIRDGTLRVVNDDLPPSSGGPALTAISAVNADLEVTGGQLTMPTFSGRLGQTIVNGSAKAGAAGTTLRLSAASVQNADLPALFALAGMAPYSGLAIAGKASLDVTATIASTTTPAIVVVTGRAASEQLKLGTLSLQNLETPFRLDKGTLTLDPIAFTLYQGRERGTVTIDLTKGAPSYAIRTAVNGLDVNQALSANTRMKDFLLGVARLEATVHGSGSTRAAVQRSLAGTMRVELRDGVIRNFPVLAAINQALGITEGTSRDIKFETLTSTAVIGAGKARTNDLVLHAGELILLGQGTLGFDQSIDIQLTAYFSAPKSGQLAQRIAVSKQLQNRRGEIAIPVTITGTTTAPNTSVDVQNLATMQIQRELQRGLARLLSKP